MMPPARTEAVPAATFQDSSSPPLPPFIAEMPEQNGGPEAAPRIPDADGTFPLDAFIVPEDARRVPAGVGSVETDAQAAATKLEDRALQEMVDRLAGLAHRIQREGRAALNDQLHSGDRFEALVATLISGFLATRDV
jgi:hypothetical protein